MPEITPWAPGKPSQATGQVPRKIPGGPVIMRPMQVYRGRIWRTVSTERGKQLQWDACFHNHTSRSAAEQCGERAARRLNRLAKGEHEPWPTDSTVRGQLGFRLRPGTTLDKAKVAGRVWPLTGLCQPCGQPVRCQDTISEWQHEEEL